MSGMPQTTPGARPARLVSTGAAAGACRGRREVVPGHHASGWSGGGVNAGRPHTHPRAPAEDELVVVIGTGRLAVGGGMARVTTGARPG